MELFLVIFLQLMHLDSLQLVHLMQLDQVADSHLYYSIHLELRHPREVLAIPNVP